MPTYAFRHTIDEVVAERTTRMFSFAVTDAAGAPLPAASLSTMTLQLYVEDAVLTDITTPGTPRDIFNANGGTVDSGGLGTLELSDDDNAVVGTGREEWHAALIEWSWNSDTKRLKGLIRFKVANLDKVP